MTAPLLPVLLLLLGTLSMWHYSEVPSLRRRLRASDSEFGRPFITPLGRDPDVVAVSSEKGAWYRDPGAVCEQKPAQGGGKLRDLSEYVVIGGDLVDVSKPGSYRVTYELSLIHI